MVAMPDATIALPPGLVARAPVASDLDAVADVILADEAAERGDADTSRADVAGDWNRPSFDLATQAVVVEDAGEVVAYAEQLGGRTNVYVAPSHHGRGVGSALLDWAEGRARAEGQPHVGQTVYDGNAAALAMHRERGYRVRWETWLFGIDLDGEPPSVPTPPPGFTVREADMERDARAVFDVIDVAFATFSDRDPANFDDWRAGYWDHEGIVPRHVHVMVDDDGRVVAALVGLVEDGDGIIDQLGVLPELHGRGLGKVLLRRAFARFAEDGCAMAVLSTESRGSARGFYEAAGMRMLRSFTRFVKDLD